MQKKSWFLFWAPYLALLILFGIDDGEGIGPTWARPLALPAGKSPAEAFGWLLDHGPDHKAALAARRMLASGLSEVAARDVAVERFQHWTKRTPASYLLGIVGAPAVPLLTELVDHDKERVRQQAALALGDVGLAAAPAVPALAHLARRSPPDSSSRAAMNAFGDVQPAGVGGWFWKIWYEVPLLAVAMIVLVPLVGGGICLRLLAVRARDGDPPIPAPPGWVPLSAAVVAVFFIARGTLDLRGERFAVEADVWLIALGVWATGACFLALRLRRRASLAPPA